MDENAGNASPRPKFGPAMSGDLIDADDTTTGSRGGGTGFDDNGEGTLYKMAGCTLCTNGQGRCRHLAVNASDTAENPATLQAKSLLGMSSNTKLDMHLNSDAEVTRIESGHGKLERLAHGLKSSKTKANIV